MFKSTGVIMIIIIIIITLLIVEFFILEDYTFKVCHFDFKLILSNKVKKIKIQIFLQGIVAVKINVLGIKLCQK